MAPSTSKAVIIGESKKPIVAKVLRPIPQPEYLLVRVMAVALNPIDYQQIELKAGDVGCRVGCDYAGVVHKVPEEDQEGDWQEGDRIMGWVHGCNRANYETGAFSEYIVVRAMLQSRIPDNMSFAEAATLGISMVAVSLGMFNRLELPLPSLPSLPSSAALSAERPLSLLICGGSTASGMAGIQFAKLAGIIVIATCSPHNFYLVRNLGADAVFDYHSPTCGADIKRLTRNGLCRAWDCTGKNLDLCAAAMSDDKPGLYASLDCNDPLADSARLAGMNRMVEYQEVVRCWDALGDFYFWYGRNAMYPDPSEMEFYRQFLRLSQPFLEAGLVRPPRMKMNMLGSGLDGVHMGLTYMLRGGKVSGEKLVYTL
ncbi:hypothetical protein E4U19_003763 [Claviceps sp. Clav32 group G5]|nr:hypothetical protein E4U19_003763 [Claviceps sp. Clav32 group G5]KAG6045605.1 hypothetical protein E4U39_002149 [Claviceps sp. Clav50 group G5]